MNTTRETPTRPETDEQTVSRLAREWRINAESVDVSARVEAAITQGTTPFFAKTVAELQEREAATRKRLAETIAIVNVPERPTATAGTFLTRMFSGIIKSVDVSATRPTPDALAALPADVARAHFALPLSKKDRTLYVAFADPDDAAIEAVALASDCYVTPLTADRTALAVAIALAYGQASAPEYEAVNASELADRAYVSLVPPAPPNPPTAIAAPAPEPEDDTRHLLRETLSALRDMKSELAALRAEVAELRRDRANSGVPRPSTARLFPSAPPDTASPHDPYRG